MEGQAGLRVGGRINRYRIRPPTVMLGLTILYIDPLSGEPVEHRTKGFDPWRNVPRSHCRRCQAGPSDDCDCPPAFRLNPTQILTNILAIFTAAVRADIKDARRIYGNYVSIERHGPEAFFVRDLLQRPKTADFLARWMGDWPEPFACESVPIPWYLNTDPAQGGPHYPTGQVTGTRSIPPTEVGHFVAALSQAGRSALANDDQQVAVACADLTVSYGVALCRLDRGMALLDAQDLTRTETLLRLAADRLEQGHWISSDGPAATTTPKVIEALRHDATAAAKLLSTPDGQERECAFCRRSQRTTRLVAGYDACICAPCASLTMEIFQDSSE